MSPRQSDDVKNIKLINLSLLQNLCNFDVKTHKIKHDLKQFLFNQGLASWMKPQKHEILVKTKDK